MHAGIDDQPDGAEALGIEIAEPAEGIIGIQPVFIDKLFGIERPAFDKGVEADELCHRRDNIGMFGQIGTLPGVARNGFVRGQ